MVWHSHFNTKYRKKITHKIITISNHSSHSESSYIRIFSSFVSFSRFSLLLNERPLRSPETIIRSLYIFLFPHFTVTGISLWGSVVAVGSVCTFYTTLVSTFQIGQDEVYVAGIKQINQLSTLM